MKRLFNDTVSPYFTLPDGVTVTKGGSTVVLNEDILTMPEVTTAVKERKIRIEDTPDLANGR